MTYLFQKLAYRGGVAAALAKLGTAAGPIDYAPRSAPQDSLSDRHSQDVWRYADSNARVTGEESSLSLPNTKAGSYATDTDNQYASGGMDADLDRPDRNHRLRSAIEGAFDANANMDQGFGPEPATTNPNGGMKSAASIGGMSSMGAGGTSMGIGSGLKGMGGSMSSPRGMMGLNSVPKPPQSAAAQSLKSPMQGNMQQQLGAGALAANAANSFGFNHRRIVGNPL